MFELSDWQRRVATQRSIDQALIGGRQCPVASGAISDAIDPASNHLLARVAARDAIDVDAAVIAARRAFDEGPRARLAPVKRKRVLLRLVELMLAHRKELAPLDSLNMGKSMMDAQNTDVPGATRAFAWYAEGLDKLYDQVAPTAQQAPAIIIRAPLRVIGAVVPWNSPLDMAAWKLAPALAVGNSVVPKPAEQSPFSALRLIELALGTGVPEGALNVVPDLSGQADKALGLHPEVDALVFTGSTEVGKYFVQYSAQSSLEQVRLECGGKSPNPVLVDCYDFDLAAEKVTLGIFFNQGEVYPANSHLLVECLTHDEFVEHLLAKVRDWQSSNPLDPANRIGAIVDRRQTVGILAAIERAQGEGAVLLGGGRQLTTNGPDSFIESTLLGDVRPDMQPAREEIFGPVLAIGVFDSEDEVIRLANDGRYGLAASLWSDDLHRAHRVARHLNTGTMSVNTVDALDAAVSLGGGKQSGFSRDLPLHPFDKYTQLKTTWFQLR